MNIATNLHWQIIDNFYENFWEVRDLALTSQYEKKSKLYYAGVNSNSLYIPQELKKVKGKFHLKFHNKKNYNYHSNCKFKKGGLEHAHKAGIHEDYRGCVTVLIYMNNEAECFDRVGTRFWIHKSGSLIKNKHAKIDLFKEQDFHVAREVPMKSNRAIVFDSRLFHSVGELFQDRLTHLFFLHKGHVKTGGLNI